MNKLLISAKEIIENILVEYNFEIIDVFEYGLSKIEFMLRKKDKIIAISLVDDMSYDFMIFNNSGDEILYSNTVKLLSLNELIELIQQDLREI